jgi:hypothetical protein
MRQSRRMFSLEQPWQNLINFIFSGKSTQPHILYQSASDIQIAAFIL